MGWGVGYDGNWKRDVGYGVPAVCDHPDCDEEIHRGLDYVCGNAPYGGDRGCGLFFCGKHASGGHRLCERCRPRRKGPFKPKPDVKEWVEWKLADESWARWREENPDAVARLQAVFADKRPKEPGLQKKLNDNVQTS